MLNTPYEDEKEKCQKMIAKLEKDLIKLKGSSGSNKSREKTTNSNSSSSSNVGSSSNSNDDGNKDEKISQLQAEIEQLKNNKPRGSKKQQENQRKIAEKEQELSDLKSNGDDNNAYDGR